MKDSQPISQQLLTSGDSGHRNIFGFNFFRTLRQQPSPVNRHLWIWKDFLFQERIQKVFSSFFFLIPSGCRNIWTEKYKKTQKITKKTPNQKTTTKKPPTLTKTKQKTTNPIMKYQSTYLYICELNVSFAAGVIVKKNSLWAILNRKKCITGKSAKELLKERIDLLRASRDGFLNFICHFFTVLLGKGNMRYNEKKHTIISRL